VTKAFPIENVLTVYTGYCMKAGVGIAQDVFDHFYPGIFTLGAAMKQPAAAAELLRQFPRLAEIAPIAGGLAECERFLSEARRMFGDSMDVDGPMHARWSDSPIADELASLARARKDSR
jgi:hypothetical protein